MLHKKLLKDEKIVKKCYKENNDLSDELSMKSYDPKQRPCADLTRDKILKVAQKLFAKKGYAATSISDIAQLAKINQSLIYHHFEDKKNLWKLVKHNLLDKYSLDHEVKAFDDIVTYDFANFLRQILQLRFDFYANNPEVVRMLSWQRLEPDKKELQISHYASQEKWFTAIKKFQKQGEVRTDVDPEVATNLIWNAVTGLYMDHYPVFSKADAKTKARYFEMTFNCLYRALSSKSI